MKMQHPHRPTKKPETKLCDVRQLCPSQIRNDVDNMVKAVKDALNQVAYHDDKQIVRVEAEKQYGNHDCVEFELLKIGE